MSDTTTPTGSRPRFGVGSVVRHAHFGSGRIVSSEGDSYVILFRGGETRRVAFTFEDMRAEAAVGDPEIDRTKQAFREVLGDHGWLDVDLELGKRWVGGTLRQPHDLQRPVRERGKPLQGASRSGGLSLDVVNLERAFAKFSDHWSPKIVGDVNDMHVKVVKLSGEFVWHHHEREDELFLVVRGRLRLQLRDGDRDLGPGELIVVPRGVEHCPRALTDEVHVVLLEPKTTLNTGDVVNERTVGTLERL